MRIQHNIMAMNAYRNYGNNTSALSKNLEKLSSGYRINRAGDDAAGLAISEKMRAQIQGLNAAQKNVKDAISFVKTAEGAMQEIQDMLSRMKYLATQSANGTYEDEVDRNALQDEVNSLLSEINRIAESANFNDIHMLAGEDATKADKGSTGSTGATGDVGISFDPDDEDANGAGIAGVSFSFADGISDEVKAAFNKALSEGASFTIENTAIDGDDTLAANDKITVNFDELIKAGYTVTFAAGEANEQEIGISGTELEVDANGNTAGKIKAGAASISFTITDAEGNEVGTIDVDLTSINEDDGSPATTTVNLAPSEADSSASSLSALFSEDDLKALEAAGITDLEFSGLTEDVKYVEIVIADGGAGSNDAKAEAAFADGKLTITLTKKGSGGGDDFATQTFDFVEEINDAIAALATDDDTEFLENITISGTFDAAAVDSAGAGKLTAFVGEAATTDSTSSKVNPNAKPTYYNINMQIGDSSKDYDTMTISIQNMSTDSLGISGLSIANIDDAHSAIDTIKTAINTVSSVRGNLGAYQNRLEHTANNLSVMTENIQDAESTIRDTDVAEEMMAYTKNNILIQSAQAMLAQANAVPQGVLQLLG